MTSRPARSTPGESQGRQPAGARHPAAPGRAARRPQALYRGIGDQRPPRARADPHHAGDRRGVRGVVRDVLQRVPGQLLAALVDARVGGAARRAHRHRPCRRLPVQGDRRPDHRRRRSRLQRYGGPATGSDVGARLRRVRDRTSTPFEDGGWIWFDITTDTKVTRAQCRLVRAGARTGPRQRRGRHPDVQPAVGLRQRAGRADVGSVGGQGDRRGDRVRPGHQEGQGPSRVRGGRRRARQPAVDSQPAQPRRLRRLQPGDVRGAEKHRLRTDPVHGRRHPRRARLDPAGAGAEPVRQDADAGRRPDAQPAGAVAPARDGRDGRLGELHVDQRGQHRVRPQLRQVPAQRRRGVPQQAAAPPHRRRLQRLVDVHDPAAGRRGARPAAAAVHQVGRRRLRAARRRARLPHRHAARRRDLAHGVERQGRRHRLAGVLPPAQPAGRRGHALGRQRHAA